MTSPELAEPGEAPALRAKPLTHGAPPWMRQTAADLFHVVAVATSSAAAEAAMHQAERTGELAFRFDVEVLPDRTDDGREVLRELHRQVPHNIRKRHDRGELRAELARHDVSIHAVEKVSGAIAGYTKSAGCCFAETATLEEASGYDERVIRRVWAFLLETGYGWGASRIRCDDRRVGGASRPCTSARSTVRVLGVMPSAFIATHTPEELLDLIAIGERVPTLPAPANDRDPSSPSSPPPPPAPAPPRARAPQAPPPAPSGARPVVVGDPHFVAFCEVFAREHAQQYGAGAAPGRVRAENQATIAGYVLELVSEACAWAAQTGLGELDRAIVREDLCVRLVRAWLAWPGTDGFLRDKGHAMGLIVGDLPKFGAPALEAWKNAQPLPLEPPPPAPSTDLPELVADAPTLDLLAAIRLDLAPTSAGEADEAICEEPEPSAPAPVDELESLRAKRAEVQARGGTARPRLLSEGPPRTPQGPRRPP